LELLSTFLINYQKEAWILRKEQFINNLTNAVSNHYAAYNEPCMLQAYLFIWASRSDLAQKHIRKAIAKVFAR